MAAGVGGAGNCNFAFGMVSLLVSGGGQNDRGGPTFAEESDGCVDFGDIDHAAGAEVKFVESGTIGVKGLVVIDTGGEIAEVGRGNCELCLGLKVHDVECVQGCLDCAVGLLGEERTGSEKA